MPQTPGIDKSLRTASPRELAFAAGIYIVAAALLTWPLVLAPAAGLFADHGDARGVVWSLWARANGLLDGEVNPLLAAPFGIPISRMISQPFSEGLLLAFTRAWNEIVATNVFTVLGFTATALATHIVLRRLGLAAFGAFLGGLAFGFCPAAVMQALGGHAVYAFNAFIPLFLLALFHNRDRRTLKSAAWVAASFAAIAYTSLYFAYFAVFVGLHFLMLDFVRSHRAERAAMMRNYAQCVVLALAMLVPVEFATIHEQLMVPRETIAQAGRVRDYHQLTVYSARPWAYLIPSIDHPLLGRYVESIVRTNLHGSNVFEQTLYLGIVPLGLLITGLVLVFWRRMDLQLQGTFLFFASGALWMFFLSLPPRIGNGVPTASYFAYEVAPMFRVYARFGIMVCFFVACAAAVVVTHCAYAMPTRRFRVFGATLAAILAFEYWTVPPGRLKPEQVPEVYRWLASEAGDIVVAEYPMAAFDEAAFYTYPFWQRVHRKRLVNGASPDNSRAWEVYVNARDLSNPSAIAALKAVGVKYVILHKAMYAEGPIPGPLKRYYSFDRAATAYNGGVPPAIPGSYAIHKTFGDDLVLTFAQSSDAGRATD